MSHKCLLQIQSWIIKRLKVPGDLWVFLKINIQLRKSILCLNVSDSQFYMVFLQCLKILLCSFIEIMMLIGWSTRTKTTIKFMLLTLEVHNMLPTTSCMILSLLITITLLLFCHEYINYFIYKHTLYNYAPSSSIGNKHYDINISV